MTALDTNAFYRESCERGYVKLEAVARNIAWTTDTAWGPMEITINLSKPEKDPRAIAAGEEVRRAAEQGYTDPATGAVRPCPLCVTQADVACGYARDLPLPALQGAGESDPWALWYSPYAYYDEHCIAMSWTHRPMHIDRAAFMRLLDVVDALPQYFFGSNADLPIVGGSILGHDHFQGGRHVFPMQLAPLDRGFEMPAYPAVRAGVVKWPVSTVRLCAAAGGPDAAAARAQLVDAACALLDAWRAYGNLELGIVAHDEDGPHNTITPIVRRVGDGAGAVYQLDLALRCNITSAEHPLGVFHPHEDLHHIKKENIGLIEVMGLAILPPRVRGTMADQGLSQDDVGHLFARVLEDAGVFKWDAAGQAALDAFLASALCPAGAPQRKTRKHAKDNP